MHPLGNPLATRPIQTGCKFTIKPYPSGEFGFIDNQNCQIGNRTVWTQTRTRNAGPEPLLTLVNIVLISIIKIRNKIIRLCMCKGHWHHATVADSISGWLTSNKLDIDLPVTVMWECKTYIWDKVYKQNLCQWCHTGHGRSAQCVIPCSTIGHHHVVIILVWNFITHHPDLVQMFKVLIIAYGRSWKARRRTWIRNGEEVRLYQSKTTKRIYTP